MSGKEILNDDTAAKPADRLPWQTPELKECGLVDLTLGSATPGTDGVAN